MRIVGTHLDIEIIEVCIAEQKYFPSEVIQHLLKMVQIANLVVLFFLLFRIAKTAKK